MTESVEDILARSAEGHTAEAVAAAHAELSAMSALLDRLFQAARPEGGFDDWKLIYGAVFNQGKDGDLCLRRRFEEILWRVGREAPDHMSPDEGYDEDVRAWKDSFDEAFAALTRDHEVLQAADAEGSSPGFR